jgi:hypothetical protein
VGLPARPGVPGSRPYTGFDAIAPGILGGTAQWIIEARRTSGNLVHSLGAYGVRDMRGPGKKGKTSVHATGRAWDCGFSRKAGYNDGNFGRPKFLPWLDRIVANANTLGVELILDYFPRPHGRGWKCTRQEWEDYTRPTIGGAPGGRWVHIELTPAMARNARQVRQAFQEVFPEIPHE